MRSVATFASQLGGRLLRARREGLPPGPRTPRVVQLYEFIHQAIPFLLRCRERYGETFTLRFPRRPPVVFTSDPSIIEQLFKGRPEDLHAGEANAILGPLLGEHSVLLLDGASHLEQRRLLLPPFHGKRMQAYGEVMRDCTVRAIKGWREGVVMPSHPSTQAITLDVILRTVFGVEGASMEHLNALIAELLERVSKPILLLPPLQAALAGLGPWSRIVWLMERVDEAIFREIDGRRRAGTEGRTDVLSMLIDARHEDGSVMSHQELRDELMTLLVAGHETTATSLAWAFHLLSQNPDAQARAHAELDEVMPEDGIDPDRMASLEWLDAICRETLRRHPVVPGVGRGLQRPMRFGSWDLPKGTLMAASIYLTHHNPRVWEDSRRFDPERFYKQRVSPYQYLPFGGGIRRCIGMAFALHEMRVVLATILHRFELRPAPGHKTHTVRRAITFAPSDGMPIVLRRRKRG